MRRNFRLWARSFKKNKGGTMEGVPGGRCGWYHGVFFALGLGLLLAGCATKSTQTWNSRVGTYTVKQAVNDLGPPTKAQQLGDGMQVGTWMVRAGTRGSLTRGHGPTFAARAFDYTVLPRDAPYIPDVNLRLLFGPDGKLIAWDRQYD